MRDVAPDDLESLLAFMYNGEVRIEEDRLKNFLRTAEMLQVQGLADGRAGGSRAESVRGGAAAAAAASPDATRRRGRMEEEGGATGRVS